MSAPGNIVLDPINASQNQYQHPYTVPNANRIPTTLDVHPANTVWQYIGTTPPTLYVSSGAGVWNPTGGSSGIFTNLTVTGNATIGGTLGVTGTSTLGVLAQSGNVSLATGGTLTVSGTSIFSGTTSFAAIAGPVQLQGGFTTTPVSAGPAASPITANSRTVEVVFSSISIAAGATQTLVVNNPQITSQSQIGFLSWWGATTGAALNVQSVALDGGAHTLTLVFENGTGATTSTANITILFMLIT